MKLALLPGMDGTGKLFAGFIAECDVETQVICLPEHGEQDYTSLADKISPLLPQEPYILLLESFSGGLLPQLLKLRDPNLTGCIFVASFLSSPNLFLVKLATRLPLSFLCWSLVLNFGLKHFFIDSSCSPEIMRVITSTICSIPRSVLKQRLIALSQLKLDLHTRSSLPCVYIRAAGDKVVSKEKADEINRVFPLFLNLCVDGPHFILQTKASNSALAVKNAIDFIQANAT